MLFYGALGILSRDILGNNSGDRDRSVNDNRGLNYLFMRVLILDKTGADLVTGNYGKFSAIRPVPLPDRKYLIPERCLTDNELSEAVDTINMNIIETNEVFLICRRSGRSPSGRNI